MSGDAMADEFDVVPGWTVAAVRELGAEHAVPGACRGSGGSAALEWFAERLRLGPGTVLLDAGAGVGGPAGWVARARGCGVVLVDPMTGACRAARSLFGAPVVAGSGEHLPCADHSVDAAWSLGVLCVSGDQPGLLAELARVVRPGGGVGLLVYTRRVSELADPPEGNHFPSPRALEAMLHEAGLLVADRAELSTLQADPSWWTEGQDAVAAVVARDHRGDGRWRTAERQARAMARLLDTGQVGGTLVHARSGVTGEQRSGAAGAAVGAWRP